MIRNLLIVAVLLSASNLASAQDPTTERPTSAANNVQVTPATATVATAAPARAMSASNTVWVGTEELNKNGQLGFGLRSDGKATMIDALSKVEGTWGQQGNQITIRFVNCVYQGTIQGGVLSGRATVTSGAQTGSSWKFSVAYDDLVRGREFRGQENLQGYGALTFRFGDNNRVEMIDATGKVAGSYATNGTEVTIRFGDCVYVGQVQNQRLAGTAQFTKGAARPAWSFNVQTAQ